MLVQIQNVQAPRQDGVGIGADHRLFETEFGAHLFLVNGSRIYTIPASLADELKDKPSDADQTLDRLRLSGDRYISDDPVQDPPLRATSLAIAQTCNLGCTYCYAQQGGFGGDSKMMTHDAAFGAIDLLLSEAAPGDRVQITYLGGEPLANRKLLRESADHALTSAAQKSIKVGFSITTNGTLLTEDDGDFFEQHGFAVTISLDGIGETHNRLRPFRDGRGSYHRIIANVTPLLKQQRRMQVSARVTVTPDNLDLRQTLDTLIKLGFHSVGFSPMLSSPSGTGEMGQRELSVMLERMVECGLQFETHIERGGRYPFLNMMNAMREIHKGTHRPYPCGAGAGYLGVSAEGGLYACHRFVGDEIGKMGDLHAGIDRTRQNAWLARRHVHFQEPCRSCWARYLCGGGCHHEVIQRGRPACDYIRGWLEYCLQAYIRLLEKCPEYFAP